MFRASPIEKKLVQEAAAAENLELSSYVRRSVLRQAELDISMRSRFMISDDQMKLFHDLLDRPARVNPALSSLFYERNDGV